MRLLVEIESCLGVTDDDIRAVLAPARSLSDLSPRDKTLALIEHMTLVAKPGRGAPKILIVLAHMAVRDWLDGELRVKLIGDSTVSVLELFVDSGVSSERLLGPLKIEVPLPEFITAVKQHPQVIAPLRVEGKIEDRRLILKTTPELRRRTVPPAFSAVSASLLPMMQSSGSPLPRIMSRPPPEPPPKPALPAIPPPRASKEPVAADPAPLLADVPIVEKAPTPAPPAGPSTEPAGPRPSFKAVSLPPHMKQVLAPLKKKI